MQKVYLVTGANFRSDYKPTFEAAMEYAKIQAEMNKGKSFTVWASRARVTVQPVYDTIVETAEELTDKSKGACPKGSPKTQPSRQGSRPSD